MYKLFYFFILINLLPCKFHAQTVATSSVTATIILPVETQQSAEMKFGRLTTVGTASEVKLSLKGVQIIKGKIKLDDRSDFAVAIFTIQDISVCAYSVTLAYDSVVTNKNNQQEKMGINLSQISMSQSNSNKKETSTTIAVGANLKIAPAQLPGKYLPANPYYLTINYN